MSKEQFINAINKLPEEFFNNRTDEIIEYFLGLNNSLDEKNIDSILEEGMKYSEDECIDLATATKDLEKRLSIKGAVNV